MDTHGNRALFSRAMVKVAACAMLMQKRAT